MKLLPTKYAPAALVVIGFAMTVAWALLCGYGIYCGVAAIIAG